MEHPKGRDAMRIESPWLATMTLCCLVVTSSGCSLIFVKPPSRDSPGQCTSSKLAPVVDSIVTGLQVGRTAYAVAAPDSVYEDPDAPISREVDVGFGVGLSALFLGSAIYGFANTSKCSRRMGAPRQPFHKEEEPAEKWE
jgi:hypothetical protein